MKLARSGIVAIAISLGLAALASAAEPDGVGTQYMVFESTAKAQAQAPFLRGLALLHNFEYERAAAEFRKAQAADPDFVMAYWGEAMTHNHPLWEEQDAAAASAVLARLGANPAERAVKARNPREGQWLGAVEALFGEGTKEARDLAYLARMRAIFAGDPDDIDARAFTGLAILGSSHGGRQIPLYMEAAGLLEAGFMTHGLHPGILHYLIHSYDDPVHAPLGERAAERYAVVAPDAGHAQHMVSHIFNALGDWEATEAANIKADAVVDRQRADVGLPESSCGHYNEWLAYALMQQGKDAAALVRQCRAQAEAEIAAGKDFGATGGWRSAGSSYADIATRWGIESGDWPQPLDWAKDRFLIGRFDLAYGQLLATRHDPAAAQTALDEMRRLRGLLLVAIAQEMPDEQAVPGWSARAILQGEAIVRLAQGETETGLAMLAEAGAGEAAMPAAFGPPVIKQPSFEILGEELLKLGRKAEAAEAFRSSLGFAPRRKRSLDGLAHAGG